MIDFTKPHDWRRFNINTNQSAFGEENIAHRETLNKKAKPELAEKRRRLEAFQEAKALKALDNIDNEWQDMWT